MRKRLWLLSFLLIPILPMEGQSAARGKPAEGAAATAGERRMARAFDEAKARGPLALHDFLQGMPKGADLHMHLSGAVYAETFLKDGAEDGLCVDPGKLEFVRGSGKGAACAAGSVPAASALKEQTLYDELVDSFSMRSFVPASGRSAHDQFFDTFGRFGGLDKRHRGEWLDEVATRAAAENEQYLEIMETPTFSRTAKLGYAIGWPEAAPVETTAANSLPENVAGTSPAELAAVRKKLLAGGLREDVEADRAEFAEALAERAKIEHCDAPKPAERAAGCSVEIRFLYQVLRANPPQQVFAQTLLAFEVVQAEEASGRPNVVGLNFVQPEDNYRAMTEYARQMRMLDYLHGAYPGVHITLHAGELAPGLVPPAGLSFHVREAVEQGHAERIGHGVDVMYERAPKELLREMAARHTMVEINLTSNDVILGVRSNFHSLPEYLAAGVPVALSTDDEGVSRIDLTHEYARAATDFNLGYLELKRMARTSLEHSFLPGASLWSEPDQFTRAAGGCGKERPGADRPGAECAAFLRGSAKAQEQWELERRYAAFEEGLTADGAEGRSRR